MLPYKCPYYESVKCPKTFESEKDREKFAKKNCYKRRYLNCAFYSYNWFEDLFESISKADPERVRDFTKAVGAVVLEKIVKQLAKDL